MPKTNRDILKREVAQAYFHYARAMETVIGVKEVFDPVHPDLGTALEVVLEASLGCQDLLAKFWTEAWGQETIRWESWL